MFGVVVAALMAATFFMPWAEILGGALTPQILLEDGIEGLMRGPWQVWAFLASFAIAALAVVVAIIGRKAGVLMLIAGIIPFGLIAHQVYIVRDQLSGVDLQLPGFDSMTDVFDLVREVAMIGGPIYIVSAAMLVVFGLVRIVRGA